MRTKSLLAGLTLTALLTGSSAFAADPRLLNLVPPAATGLAGVNVATAEITPFGQFLMTGINSSLNQQLQSFIGTTGFDPRHDVTEILAASSALTPQSVLVLALGNFNVAPMTALLAQKSPQVPVQTYGGATLITALDGKTSVAFLGANIAIAGDTASVKAAVDRSASMNAIDPALNVQVQTLSANEDAWAISTIPVASMLPALTAGGANMPSQIMGILNGIQASSGGVKFGSTVQVTGQLVMKDAATAQSLADVMQALASMASLSASTSGQQNSQTAGLGQLLQGFSVKASDAAVNIALAVPESAIEALLNNAKNQAAPAVRQSIRPAIVPAGPSGQLRPRVVN